MSEEMHTTGPWFKHREGFSTVYVEARIGGGLIQEVAACGPTNQGSEQQEANARLIATAPELLEACKLGLKGLEAAAFDPLSQQRNAHAYAAGVLRSAITKATGQPA
ncbi:hypothetical protein QRD40_10675 [Comamonas sp. Y6]|uniref:CO dehydrogenase flavoprotein C-terminal domain-containing protein n=1 Tax=Comamonas resistens TaxID=3046670 RepID=A0ABY8SVR8_9BURK|nr:hypothetical protein [Comamonas resistens]MDL5036810.1 hypothetical protein [Comamonas resistens]WHS67120.1 hypothetical protein QMY55_08390 [Comamonas resistens]